MPSRIAVFAGFRCHILLPGDVAGSITDTLPTWPGLTVNDGTFFRKSKPVLRVERKGDTTTVTALTDLWLQELALSVKVAGPGMWRGYGQRGRWVATTNGVEGWLPLAKKGKDAPQAFYSTVHFSRVKNSPRYCVGVEYRDSRRRMRFGSDGGFADFQLAGKPGAVPWQGASAFDRWPVRGVYVPRWEPLRRWELAGHPPDQGWMHFLAGPGGAGAIVNERGRTPRPGSNPTAADGYDRLHRPDTYRLLRRGGQIVQTLTLRRP